MFANNVSIGKDVQIVGKKYIAIESEVMIFHKL